ncbi:MAG: NfeD family protein [Candidatus Eisenbacteria bacterium]|jgi:membrane protein implicated in regulation of membrane protease activity|nr:NfeD family protein [Candidatus Eisenbacteria bacterium]
MSMAWWIWFIAAAVFAISEVFTAGFFLFWFGIGAAVAGVFALVGLSALWQWISFIVVSSVLAMLSRRFAERFSKPQPDGIGADRLRGRRGIVVETVDNRRNTGRVRLDKEEWRAESETDEPLPPDTGVVVTRIEGTRAIVRPCEKEE